MIDGDALMGRGRGLPHAGDLLAVEAIDRTGLDRHQRGRVRADLPGRRRANPLLMSAGEREKTAGAFQRLVSQLGAEETVQIYIDARPVNLAELLADCRREVAGQRRTGTRPRADARSAGAGALAAVRGDGGVAAAARRRPGGGAGLLLRGRAVGAAPERRQSRTGVGQAEQAADRVAGAAGERAPSGGARAARSRRRAARRARSGGHGDRAARRRTGRAAAVGEVQPDPGRRRAPERSDRQCGGAGRARRGRRPGPRAPGGSQTARADRDLEP